MAEIGYALSSEEHGPADLVRNARAAAQLHVCWAKTEDRARKTAHEWWPNAAITGELGQELPLPRPFERAAKMVTEQDVAEGLRAAPTPRRTCRSSARRSMQGSDHVYIHQVGPDQDRFLEFYAGEVLPKLR